MSSWRTSTGTRSARVRGTAVFMTISTDGTPPTLLHHVKHNHMLHDHVVLLTIQAADAPAVADGDRLRIERLSHGFYRLVAWYGYMETPNVPKAHETGGLLRPAAGAHENDVLPRP